MKKGYARFLAAILGTAMTLVVYAADNAPHWEYTGQLGSEHWGEIDATFLKCKDGKNQSPINIIASDAGKSALKPIKFDYTVGAADVVNTGHTVQVNLANAGTAVFDGSKYQLLQFHFHTPSEEKISGRTYPLVAHLVHKNTEGKLAVVAVLFDEGAENAALKDIFNNMPTTAGDKKTLSGNFNVTKLLPPKQTYYAFTGSLTTPPCSEEVRWHVLKDPVTLSSAQLASFQKLYAMNARPVQSLNGRKVQGGK